MLPRSYVDKILPAFTRELQTAINVIIASARAEDPLREIGLALMGDRRGASREGSQSPSARKAYAERWLPTIEEALQAHIAAVLAKKPDDPVRALGERLYSDASDRADKKGGTIDWDRAYAGGYMAEKRETPKGSKVSVASRAKDWDSFLFKRAEKEAAAVQADAGSMAALVDEILEKATATAVSLATSL